MKNEFFKSLDYYDKRSVKADLAVDLQAAGWTVYGYYPYKSAGPGDDYGDPASWDGVATKGDCVLVVDNNRAHRSGEVIKAVDRQSVTCPNCNGTGADPDPEAWTLELARMHPAAYIKYMNEKTGRAVMAVDAPISPIRFTADGKSKCDICHGTGKEVVKTSEQVLGQWPTYQANPNRKAWHLERAGKVITDGMSIAKLSYTYYAGPEARALAKQARGEFIRDLQLAADGIPVAKELEKALSSPGSVEIVDYSERAIALRGDTKPIKDTLHALGGKFNPRLTDPATGKRFVGWIFSKRRTDEIKALLNG